MVGCLLIVATNTYRGQKIFYTVGQGVDLAKDMCMRFVHVTIRCSPLAKTVT